MSEELPRSTSVVMVRSDLSLIRQVYARGTGARRTYHARCVMWGPDAVVSVEGSGKSSKEAINRCSELLAKELNPY